MAETLSISGCSAGMGWNLQNTTSFGTNSINSSSFSYSKTFSNGTGAGKAQKLFVDQVTIAGAGTQTYDLSGSLTDPLGATVTFANVKGLYISHETTTATGKAVIRGLFMGANATTQPIKVVATFAAATDGLILHPGGCWFVSAGTAVAAGYTVTNTTLDTLIIENLDAASISVKIAVFGE